MGDYVGVSGQAPKGHRELVVVYSTVGPFNVAVYGWGSTRVQGVGSFVVPIKDDWYGGAYVSVTASPDFTWSYANPGQSKIEIRVVTR